MWQFHPRDLPDSNQDIYFTKKKSILKASPPCEKKKNYVSFQNSVFSYYTITFEHVTTFPFETITQKHQKNHQETWSPTPEHPDTSENCELAIHSSLGLLLDLGKAFWAHWSLPWTVDQMSQCKPTGGSQSIHNFLFLVFEAYRTEANPQHCTSCHRAEPKVSRSLPSQWELSLKKC